LAPRELLNLHAAILAAAFALSLRPEAFENQALGNSDEFQCSGVFVSRITKQSVYVVVGHLAAAARTSSTA
jgi:hypothetical protein